jgi:hypothetical protein
MDQLGWKDLVGPRGVLLAVIIAQIVTVSLIFANNKLGYKRSQREKLWDLKRELYSKVISKVGDIQSAYSMTSGLSGPSEFLCANEDIIKQAMENEYDVFQIIIEAQELFKDNYVILSRTFLKTFRPINDIEMLNFYDPKSYDDLLAERRRFFDKLHKALVEQARKELETDI